MIFARRQVVALSLGFWTLFALVCGMQVWLSMITHGHSMARILVYEVVVWDVWVLFGFLVAWLARRAPLVPPRLLTILIHLLAAFVLTLAHAAWCVGWMLILKPFDRMNPTGFAEPFFSFAFSQSLLELLVYAMVLLSVYAADYYRKYRERELLTAQLEASLAEARLHALELQIQPHFLFNTLNAISALVRTGQRDQAVGMIAGLSDLLRYALDRADQRVTVDDEAGMLRRYLEIQQLRFPDRLSYVIDIAPDARRAAVPVLLLQPLAENAIRHGIARHASPGQVHVRAFRAGDMLRVEVLNSGRLAGPVAHGIGLSNTVARLEQLYGSQQSFTLADSPEGVRASLTIPWTEVA